MAYKIIVHSPVGAFESIEFEENKEEMQRMVSRDDTNLTLSTKQGSKVIFRKSFLDRCAIEFANVLPKTPKK